MTPVRHEHHAAEPGHGRRMGRLGWLIGPAIVIATLLIVSGGAEKSLPIARHDEAAAAEKKPGAERVSPAPPAGS